ncbi:tRNA (N6-threonylcarbamoyladenosine(37)-N6)-methyltransferase TrmO [Marivita sp.]|uniref:tRNA (N6-threonylcarbamoyladenosine(37)-N6)-methyltransferase TrmO n=1 Tax=Marivita sp. TaxID=2003365 RepID=UPI0025BAF36E|nr:tRNA (N6-threonylcarbamoyladenosine(37)-N6)-methyltransferase TrmO [Marivita sp.]
MTRHDSKDLRANEVVIDPPKARDAGLMFVGLVRTPFTTRDLCPRQGRLDGPDCRLELEPDWESALEGIERFDHLDVLYWLHESRRDLVAQSPRNDGTTTGTFALRSPVRPNPIGLSRVRLIRREGPVLIVKGLDCLDKTPLLDIKPERCAYTPPAPDKAADTA